MNGIKNYAEIRKKVKSGAIHIANNIHFDGTTNTCYYLHIFKQGIIEEQDSGAHKASKNEILGSLYVLQNIKTIDEAKNIALSLNKKI